MLPAYRLIIPITPYLTMERLENQAALQERAFNSANDYRPPPNPEDALCPAFAYVAPKGKHGPYYSSRNPAEAVRAIQCEEDEHSEFPTELLEAILNKRRSGRANNYNSTTESKFEVGTNNNNNTTAFSKLPEPIAAAIATPTPVRKETTDARCWNCEQQGHVHRNCTAPRRRFCYSCRHPGVTSRTCPKCNAGKAEG